MQAFDKRTTAARPDLAAADLLGRVEATSFVAGERRRVRNAVLDLRREPSHDSPLDTQALHGEYVTLYEEHEGWAWLQLVGDGYVGYAAAGGIDAESRAPTHRVLVPRTFAYAQASIKSNVTMALPRNANLAVVDRSGDFAVTSAGGFVWNAHLCPLQDVAVDFVAVAESFLDVPYLWGGKTSLGLDCSALVQVSLAAAGIRVPRDSDLQELSLGASLYDGHDLGRVVEHDLANLRRGDLVFWKGHVGIMRDAQTLLHASGHHMLVVVEPLRAARARIAAAGAGAITSIKRLPQPPA